MLHSRLPRLDGIVYGAMRLFHCCTHHLPSADIPYMTALMDLREAIGRIFIYLSKNGNNNDTLDMLARFDQLTCSRDALNICAIDKGRRK